MMPLRRQTMHQDNDAPVRSDGTAWMILLRSGWVAPIDSPRASSRRFDSCTIPLFIQPPWLIQLP